MHTSQRRLTLCHQLDELAEVGCGEHAQVAVAELQARIKKVIAIAESYKAEQIDGSEGREITIKIPNAELKFSGLDYINNWAMPNFYFHIVTAYDILRTEGVRLGKRDFLGRMRLKG